MKTKHTEATGIEIEHVECWNCILGKRPKRASYWRHVDTNDGRRAHVGPCYSTRAEILADHDRYVAETWGA